MSKKVLRGVKDRAEWWVILMTFTKKTRVHVQ